MALSMKQKQFRRRGISASDIPAICGLNPWKSPIKVWEEKVYDPESDTETTVDQERGNELEDALLKWMGRRAEVKIFHNTGEDAITFQSPTHELVLATPDGLGFDAELPGSFKELRLHAQDAITIAEVKSPGPGTAHDWISPLEASDGVPEYYVPQAQWQMGALGLDRNLVGALVGRDLWTYRLGFNEELFKTLLHIGENFWENNVLKQIPPPVDESEDYASHLVRRHPGHASDELRRSNPEVDAAVIKLREAREAMAGLESMTRLQQNIIKDVIRGAAGIAGLWGKILWRKSKDSMSYDKKAMVAWFERNQPDELVKFRIQKTGSRSFKPYLK